jgi:hypothetical protein
MAVMEDVNRLRKRCFSCHLTGTCCGNEEEAAGSVGEAGVQVMKDCFECWSTGYACV